MDYEDVYYVTDDGRNAARPARVIDHRTTASRVPGRVPALVAAAAAPAAAASVFSPPTPTYSAPQPAFFGSAVPQPTFFGSAVPQNAFGSFGYPLFPSYAMPPVSPLGNLSSMLGGFGNIGSLANIVAQVFAALIPLPASPPIAEPNDGDPACNAAVNSSNLIKYQNALAQFARRDQQILTIGSVLEKLLKRPGMVMG